MAVLHHAFKCPINSEIEKELVAVTHIWQAGNLEKLSHLAKERYAALADRQDIHAAFHLDPDGALETWLQPRFISPGLAIFVALAGYFEPLPGLSAHYDTNHTRLGKYLPSLGWSEEDVASLIGGRSIEAMLREYVSSSVEFVAGGFAHTGGWTAPRISRQLRVRLDTLMTEPPSAANEKAYEAFNALTETNALKDAVAMLEPLHSDDWLVTSITH